MWEYPWEQVDRGFTNREPVWEFVWKPDPWDVPPRVFESKELPMREEKKDSKPKTTTPPPFALFAPKPSEEVKKSSQENKENMNS